MHSKPAAALLCAAAVAAVATGCVAAKPGPVPAPDASRPRPAAGELPHPQVLPGPGRESIATVGPAPRRSPTPRSAAPERAASPAPEHAAPRRTPSDTAPAPAPRQSDPPAARADICTLGREYGGWPADSDQARICRDAYGTSAR
ncbi:hypothetical protein [Streptomyces boninensis]|uniref:hypothetical protein n=1 Tax=Streptomyces boninensis TaxID=2039455 RepID=UPI003B211D4B